MSATVPTTPGPPAGHRYHVVDGLSGWWLCETTDEFPEPTPIGLIDDLLAAAVAATPSAPDAERGNENGTCDCDGRHPKCPGGVLCCCRPPSPLAETDTGEEVEALALVIAAFDPVFTPPREGSWRGHHQMTAEAILASDWLAGRDAAVARAALLAAADEVPKMSHWGVRKWLRDRAEPDHE